MSSLRQACILLLITSLALAEAAGYSPPDEHAALGRQAGGVLPTDAYGDPLPPGARRRLGTTRFHIGDNLHVTLCLSANGKVLAAADDREHAWVFEAATGKLLRQLHTDGSLDNSVALSPDGRTVAAVGAYNHVQFWDVATG